MLKISEESKSNIFNDILFGWHFFCDVSAYKRIVIVAIIDKRLFHRKERMKIQIKRCAISQSFWWYLGGLTKVFFRSVNRRHTWVAPYLLQSASGKFAYRNHRWCLYLHTPFVILGSLLVAFFCVAKIFRKSLLKLIQLEDKILLYI